MLKHHGKTLSESSEQVTHSSEDGTQLFQETVVGSNEVQPPSEPEYIKLWVLTKRHKDYSWDEVAEQKLEDFRALHKQQVELYGVDNLTVQEAYLKVLGTSSGYINGLGFGPKAPKRIREERSDGGGIEIAHQMAQQMEQMEQQSRERDREIERLKEDKAQMLQVIDKLQKDAAEREARMNSDFRALQDKLAAFFVANPQG